MTPGTRVTHNAYGDGAVLELEKTASDSIIVHVKWDTPELGRFPEDAFPYEHESFWTDKQDLIVLG